MRAKGIIQGIEFCAKGDQDSCRIPGYGNIGGQLLEPIRQVYEPTCTFKMRDMTSTRYLTRCRRQRTNEECSSTFGLHLPRLLRTMQTFEGV